MRPGLSARQIAAVRDRLGRARDDTPSGAIPRRASAGAVELSFAQQRLWFLDQLMPGNPFYNIPAALPLRLAIDEPALRQALAEIVRRHEALRTVFEATAGGPRQQVSPPYDPTAPPIDLSGLPSVARQRELQRVATEEARGPFDLARGPLVRTRLVHLGPADHVLLLTMHHIVSDGWSMGVFFRELMQLYDAFRRGAPSPLPALPIQYADYAEWQRRELSPERVDSLLQYWRRQLAGLPTLALIADRPRPPIATFRGAFLDVAFDLELTLGLESLARRRDATLFQVLLAGFKAVLARYAGQTDIVVGAPIANRTRPELEGLIGFFVNNLVLRTDLGGNPTFAEIIGRVRQTTIAAYEHQDLPFERLVEDLQPARDMSRNPLAQVTLQIQNAPGALREKPDGLDLAVRVDRATAIFDMAFSLWETKQGLIGGIEYATDIFDRETVQQLVDSMTCILRAVVTDDSVPLDSLPLTAPEQREANRALLRGRSFGLPQHGLFEAFREVAHAAPRDVVLVDASGTVTREQLLGEALSQSAEFRASGVGPGGTVAIALPRGRQFVVAMLAALDAGAAWMPIDPALPASRMQRMLQLARPQRILVDGEPISREQTAYPDTDLLAQAGAAAAAGDAPAYVLFTSGSTGYPKGVVIPQRALMNHMAWMRAELPLATAGGRVLQRTPLHFDAAVWELWAPLLGDGVLLLPPPFDPADTGQLCTAIEGLGATVLQIVPSLLRMLLDDPLAGRCRSLRRLCVGGEPLTAELIAQAKRRWPGVEVVNLYGPSETTIDSTWWVADPGWPADAPIPIGRPISNTQIGIRDAHGVPLPPGIVGEICISGAGLARGYLGAGEHSRSRFVVEPDGMRHFRSGDRGWARRDGLLFCAGRTDDQVKIRGNRIELGDVEAALVAHPSVQSAVALAVPDESGNHELVGFVTLNSDPALAGDGDARALQRSHVAEWLALYECVYDLRTAPAGPPDFDTVGWVSSYDGQPIAAPAMRDWLAATVARLNALRPRRVLEIGCGAGLIARELAPSCQRYVGCDFAPPALERARRAMPDDARSRVRWVVSAAHEIASIGERGFDLVVLNSVVQYFPSVSYLAEVLAQARSVLAPGGRIFIGDVRHHGLMEAFHADVQAARAAPDLPCAKLREHTRVAVAQDKELLVAPTYFWRGDDTLPGFSGAAVRLKRGAVPSEMLDFRYDVVLETASHVGAAPVTWHDWRRSGLQLPLLRTWLDRQDGPVALAGIPNARVQRGASIQARLAEVPDTEPTGALWSHASRDRGGAIDPEELATICEAALWDVELIPSPERAQEFAAILHRGTLSSTAADAALLARYTPTAGRMASNPLLATIGPALERELKARLRELLPSAMVPSRIEPLARMPMLPNGKSDRTTLAALAAVRHRPAPASLLEPADALEALLADVWATVLRLKRVGVADHFFDDLGGHSLLATQVVSRIRAALEIDMPLRLLFEHPTVRKLAAGIVAWSEDGRDLVQMAELVREVNALDEAALDERLAAGGGQPG